MRLEAASKLGWTASLGLAYRNATNRCSGGCGVLVRTGAGIAVSNLDIKSGYSHRIHRAWVGNTTRGRVHIFSIYLKDQEGASETNLAILGELAVLIKSVKGPWIVGGNFNMSPTTLKSTNWHNVVGGNVHAPQAATCLAAAYDYFVVKRGFDNAVEAVQVLDDSCLYPHSPCRLHIKGDARRKKVRTLARPMKISGALPIGPANLPSSYLQVRMACAAGRADEAIKDWYRTARQEFASLTGVDDKYRRAKFVWRSAAGDCAEGQAGNTSPSTAWRVLGRRTDAMAAIINKDSSATDPNYKETSPSRPLGRTGSHSPCRMRCITSSRATWLACKKGWLGRHRQDREICKLDGHQCQETG